MAKPSEPEGAGQRLVLENVRCFGKVVVPLDARVTVIIGPNGSGKTTIAEAIASLSPGDDEGLHDFPLRRGATAGSILLYGDGSRPIAECTHPASGSLRRRHDQHVFVYGQYRALRPPPGRRARPARWDPMQGQQTDRPLPENLADALRRSSSQTLFDFDEYLFRDFAAYVALLEARSAYEPAAKAVWS